MDNNIEHLIYENIINNNEYKSKVEQTQQEESNHEDNSYELEKLLHEISISCITQYDKDKLLQSLYFSHGSNVDYFRAQLNNAIKDQQYQDKIYQAEQILNQMSETNETITKKLNFIDLEIKNLKPLLLIDKSKYKQFQIFESKVEKIKDEILALNLNSKILAK